MSAGATGEVGRVNGQNTRRVRIMITTRSQRKGSKKQMLVLPLFFYVPHCYFCKLSTFTQQVFLTVIQTFGSTNFASVKVILDITPNCVPTEWAQSFWKRKDKMILGVRIDNKVDKKIDKKVETKLLLSLVSLVVASTD